VWKVFETAEAVFEVDDYEHYVKVQSESALRNLATSYAYDAHDDAQGRCAGHTNAVADHLKREIHERLVKAGVEVIEARISHLAYAPEIRGRDAAAASRPAHHRRAPAHRRRRRRHGRNGARHAVEEIDHHARRRAQGGDGQQPAGGAVRRSQHAAGRSTRARSTSNGTGIGRDMADRNRSCFASIRPAGAVQRWANDDLRSLNAQIEFLLRRALQQSGREHEPKPEKKRP
jgi:hypothetical protein